MENKRLQKLSVAALIISVLPLMTFIPVLLHIMLTDGGRSVWAVLLFLPCSLALYSKRLLCFRKSLLKSHRAICLWDLKGADFD